MSLTEKNDNSPSIDSRNEFLLILKFIKMKKAVLHIPHSSTYFPNYLGFVVDQKTLDNETLILTDHFTDELFITPNSIPVTAPFSRVFCDVERFRKDCDEVMSEKGMGATYTKLENGELMRVLTTSQREKILQDYYDVHHKKLTQEVENQLAIHQQAIIIDCHSFPETPHPRALDKTANRPDICIGADSFHTPKDLLERSIEYFKSAGLSVKVNSPYKGTIVPLQYYNIDRRVYSIMIEVNRKLYLTDDFEKSDLYFKTFNICQKYFDFVNI
ncbi:N-formylglutamate amidohydrolase [Tamlana haliotis]|uniref:N-formylglutamate amidohydrolase n=1 Tax=Pseudotamlana haliotis TaxID=2614804 RepID=A0A6N6MG81_9FLAO|nr:N-formylglutamate amidohydrolase [Tamlana haliotis]KAB1067945.1 N-formylglutamate amidohydrolase [Tamlana haliotis]